MDILRRQRHKPKRTERLIIGLLPPADSPFDDSRAKMTASSQIVKGVGELPAEIHRDRPRYDDDFPSVEESAESAIIRSKSSRNADQSKVHELANGSRRSFW
jgi:hypothetical protein